jgi:hypothetical protein
MFTRRKQLDRRRHYSREFLVSLSSKLKEAGFDRISVILPHNYPSVDPKNPEVDLDNFLQRERNYAAVIFKAVSTEKQEMLKILFVNSNSKAVFADDTFPMAESEPSGLFFQSPDPGRAYSVFEYFYELLTTESLRSFIERGIASLVGTLVIAAEILPLLAGKVGFLSTKFGFHPAIDVIISLVAIIVVFRFAALPTGLWIKPKRETKLIYLANMAIKGELKDNPLVQLIVTVAGGLIVAFLAKFLGLI